MRTIRFNLNRVGALFLVVTACFATGCATPLQAPSELSCDQLEKEIRETEQGRRLAVEKQQDPWQFVIPFAVAGVHIASKSAVSEADRWLAQLRQESRLKGCARQA